MLLLLTVRRLARFDETRRGGLVRAQVLKYKLREQMKGFVDAAVRIVRRMPLSSSRSWDERTEQRSGRRLPHE